MFLEAVRITKKLNCKIISIVNLLTSSLTRKGDVVLGMNCGPEIGVQQQRVLLHN